MPLFTRREKPPAELTAALEKDERLLSWADTAGGDIVAATSFGVWWPEADGRRRMPWQHIDKAVWREGVLMIIEADVVDDMVLVDRDPVRVTLERARDLPPVIRKRIEANVVRSELLSVGGGAVRFVARRRPGQDGIVWWARLEPGTRETAALRSAVAARLAILRSSDSPIAGGR